MSTLLPPSLLPLTLWGACHVIMTTEVISSYYKTNRTASSVRFWLKHQSVILELVPNQWILGCDNWPWEIDVSSGFRLHTDNIPETQELRIKHVWPLFYVVTVRALMYDFIQVHISRGNIITAELNTDIWWTLIWGHKIPVSSCKASSEQ